LFFIAINCCALNLCRTSSLSFNVKSNCSILLLLVTWGLNQTSTLSGFQRDCLKNLSVCDIFTWMS
jgi:hypothetical protein